ncbi:NADH-quinone oxidoreductase subunit C [Panacibacter sp. DH6]|uniref:NADH-quinone oxidoreductase subunit C n=1 Tax=Panacibacter microcysteis TaxID=2793269 RepID=A0A931EBE5_9BACT|nr:NADH-quinone oxidoreductase subunit C [Panacibacter microcysteis]MBG9377446.1 NADH-quinone oxidoreductase subunit C [Panacibacter microcysteis]
MTNDELKIKLGELFPSSAFEEGTEWTTMLAEPVLWKEIALQLRHELVLDFLFCITCVDWKTHLAMVYHLRSTTTQDTVVVKAKLDRENPQIATVSDIWRTAEFHEREAYDLFGVQFIGHPDLRRLFLTDDYEGFPLRKDFEDPVNMIKL